METEGQYPKKVCISVWGDKINATQLIIANKLKIDFDMESREYNSRWYTDIKAWRVETMDSSSGHHEPLLPGDEPPGLNEDIPF